MADEVKKYVSEVTLPNGKIYYIKDAEARELIAAIEEAIKGGMHYIGATTTPLTDGAHTPNVAINGKTVTPKAGDIVTNGSKEYVWDNIPGTDASGNPFTGTWHELGDLTGLGEFAYADTGTGKFTPSGTVSKPTFTGSESAVTVTYSKNASGPYQITGSISKPVFTGIETDVTITTTEKTDGNYTPKGTVSKPTFTGSSSNVSFTIAENSNGNYTPAGTVSQPTFAGDTLTSTGKIDIPTSATTTATTTNKTATVSPAASGTVTYTPAGTITDVGITYNTASVTPIKSVGTLPSLDMSVADNSENLVITWGAGTLPEKGTAVNAVTGTKAITQPTFSGTGVRLVTGNIAVPTSFTTTLTTEEKTVTVTGTPTGTVERPIFSGTKVLISGTTKAAGSVSQPTFSGTTVDITGKNTAAGTISDLTFTGDNFNLSGKTTASGTVSQPIFTGTEGTVTVNPVKKTT